MGAYLSEPVKEKHSLDEANSFLQVGASSMQGWRISQEDAHNCILKLDENISYFAVYDGHGGAEVAKYCSENLPNFLKNLQSFKDENFEEALKEAFLKFDSTLLEESVIEELKKIAGERNPAENNSNIVDDEEEEDLAELCQEGSLPLEKVLAKYKAKTTDSTQQEKSKNEEVKPGSSGTTKPLSPRLRSKRSTEKSPEKEPQSSAFSSGAGTSSSIHLSDSNDDSQVSSSETKCVSENKDVDKQIEKSCEAVSVTGETSKSNGENNIVEPVTFTPTSPAQYSISPDSSITNSIKGDKVQNGDIKAETSSGVSSSTSNNENGPKLLEPLQNKESSELDSDDKDYEYSEDEEEDEEASDESDESDEYEKGFVVESSDEEADDWMYKDDTYGDDKFCANMIEEPGKDSGCTAVVAVLNGRDLYVANAGDSRCVVCRGGKAIDMSIDHKPEDDEELKRIVKAGGHVTIDGRVNGGLNLSRAIGDHAYKMNSALSPEEQMISALPDVKKLILEPNDEFMILACDGIWNYMSSEEVVELVKEFIDEDFEEMSAICEELLSTCLAPSTLGDGTGCDNMTAIIIRFKPTLFELPTKLNPDETIISEDKKISDTTNTSESTSNNSVEENPKTKKRSISPTSSDSSDLASTTTAVHDSGEQSKKRFKLNVMPSSTSASEISTEPNDKMVKIENEIAEENDKQLQMDAEVAEADAAAAAITTTSET